MADCAAHEEQRDAHEDSQHVDEVGAVDRLLE